MEVAVHALVLEATLRQVVDDPDGRCVQRNIVE
jgi:hypothetical protein